MHPSVHCNVTETAEEDCSINSAAQLNVRVMTFLYPFLNFVCSDVNTEMLLKRLLCDKQHNADLLKNIDFNNN